jgi:Recombinase zinc beta ribbon domain
MTLAATATQPSMRQNYLLSGRIRSPHGARMQGISSPVGARSYRCPHRQSHRTPGTDRCECGRLHAATIEHAVWEQVTSLIGNPAALEALAADRDSERRKHAERERASLSQLAARIAATEAEIADEYSALRDEGFDPAAARAAIRRRNDRLVSLRKERADLLRIRGKNLAAAGLATRLRA